MCFIFKKHQTPYRQQLKQLILVLKQSSKTSQATAKTANDLFFTETLLEAFSQSSLQSLSENLPDSPLGSLLGIPFIESQRESLENL